MNADVIVIGAGIVGSACAWRLAQAGLNVRVLERSAPGSEASQAALGVLSFHARPEMPAAFNELCRQSQRYYPAVIDELSEILGERVDYRAGGQLMVALTEADLSDLDAAFHFNVAAGIEVERPTPSEFRLLAANLNPNIHGSLFFPDDAWVDNMALTQAIVRAAKKAGVVFERAAVDAVERGSGGETGVRWGGQVQWADWVVVAAGCWSGEIAGMPPLPVEPVRGQALAVAGQPSQRVVMSPRGYLVPKGDGQTLIGATVEHVGFDQSNTLAGLHEVSAAGIEIAPTLRRCEFLGAWAGLRPATSDKLPFVGPFQGWPNLIAATGHFRNGILFAPVTAEIVRGIVTGERPVVDFQPFSPGRAANRHDRDAANGQ